jgi:hypothetical protein
VDIYTTYPVQSNTTIIVIICSHKPFNEMGRDHVRVPHQAHSAIELAMTVKVCEIKTQNLYLCLGRYLSAFLVFPNRELHLYASLIPHQKKRLVHPDNRGI